MYNILLNVCQFFETKPFCRSKGREEEEGGGSKPCGGGGGGNPVQILYESAFLV